MKTNISSETDKTTSADNANVSRYGSKPREAKRIAKVSGRPLKNFHVIKCYLNIPFRLTTIPVIYPFFLTVINDFFAIQFLEKIHILHIPIIHVDHPLDDKVPFEPKRVTVYLDFINFWIRPLEMMIDRFGAHKAMKFVREWIKLITLAYHEAGRMYKFRMSTTNRPDYKEMKEFRQIHRADPHFLCVPSLHISIVVLVYSFYRNLFKREHFTEQESTLWNKELYEGAVKIAETVLYVKQHSVNCIPAALYMMTKLVPDLFTPDDAVGFINDLFKNETDVSAEDRRAIVNHISFMYERLLLEGCHDDDWRAPVQRWIVQYKTKS